MAGANGAAGIEVRRASERDRAALAALVREFRDHLQARAPSDAEIDAHLPRVMADPAIEFACAWSGARAVGYTHTRFYDSLWVCGVEALLEDLFVSPAARRRGVGCALLRAAIERARARGARLLGLTTNEGNLAAHALYRSHGMRPQAAAIYPNGREIRWTLALN